MFRLISKPNRTIQLLAAVGLIAVVAGTVTATDPHLDAKASAPSIALYFSAPFVQNSHLTGAGVLTETFNAATLCSQATGVGAVTASGCAIQAGEGPDPAAGEPTIGGNRSKTVGTSGSLDVTFTFQSPAKYVGLWWMMGSGGNTVQFYDANNSVISTLSSEDIMSFLGISYASVTNSDTGTLNTVDGSTHLRKRYFRAPQNYTGTVEAPEMDYNTLSYANEPWVYLNLFVPDSVDVTKVRLSGTAFEFDNLTISTNTGLTPQAKMVLVKNIPIITTPGTPGTPTATAGNGQATVTISPPTSGGTPATYLVTASPGGATCTVTSPATSCNVTGLTNGTSYTFTSTATNTAGTSSPSSSSNSVTPLAPPSTPGTPTAEAANASATLSWAPSATGTAPITYSVETIPSGGTCVVASSGSGTTASCTGLTNGTEYQFRVTASNGPSSSATSGTSTAVTPVAPPQPAPVAPVAKPEPPQAEDVQLTGSDQSLRVSMAPAAPEAVTKYRITLSPGGRSCELAATDTFCEISGAKQGVEYKVLATASNAAGTSKSATLNKRVILTSSGWLRYTGKMSVANFVANSSELLPNHKAKIRKLNSGKPKALHMTCTGFAAGPAISERIFELAADRAKSVCQQMKAHSGATFSTSARVPGLRFEGANRKVLVRVYSELN